MSNYRKSEVFHLVRMSHRPVTSVPGIGESYASLLEAHGVTKVILNNDNQ